MGIQCLGTSRKPSLESVPDLGQTQPIAVLADIQRLSVDAASVLEDKNPQHLFEFLDDLRPGFELNPAAPLFIGDDPSDEGRGDAGAAFEQVAADQGVDQGALAGFDRAHHGNSQWHILQRIAGMFEMLVPFGDLKGVDEPVLRQLFDSFVQLIQPLPQIQLELPIVVHDTWLFQRLS